MNVYMNTPIRTCILGHDVLLLERYAAPSASIRRGKNSAVLRYFRARGYRWWVRSITAVCEGYSIRFSSGM